MTPALDTADGCVPTKMMSPPEEQDMEVGSEASAPSSQIVSPPGTSPSEDRLIQSNVNNVSNTSQSQPATQPLDNSQLENMMDSTQVDETLWGQLYPHCGTFPR